MSRSLRARHRLHPTSDHTRLLIEGTATFGVHLSSSQITALQTYLFHLTTWNRQLNLTSIREPELMIRHHLIDCAAAVRFLHPTGHIIDVGSGAGLPGIPIKILLPEKKVTLVDCRRKRANFLRHVIRQLRLANIQILEQRVEALLPRELEPLEEIIARAFTDNTALLQASSRLLSPGRRCMIMHGPQGFAFLEKICPALDRYHLKALPPEIFALPFGGEVRTVLFFEKI